MSTAQTQNMLVQNQTDKLAMESLWLPLACCIVPIWKRAFSLFGWIY